MENATHHPPEPTSADRLQIPPSLAGLCAELLWQAARAENADLFLRQALPTIAVAVGADYTALVVPGNGRWAAVGESGVAKPLPVELLADALDRETARAGAGWVVSPLSVRTARSEALAVHLPRSDDSAKALAALEHLSPVFHQSVAARSPSRGDRAGSAVWRPSWKSPASGTRRTRSSRCWCRWPRRPRGCSAPIGPASSSGTGRTMRSSAGPALGIAGGELRIPDDRGVVGEVIRSGQPRRVDAAAEPDAIDRNVDAQLRYHTRTLVVRPAARPLRRAVRRLRTDQQARRRVHAGRRRGPGASWPPTPPWPWKTPRTASNCSRANRQIAEQAAERVRLIGESPAIEALRSIIRRVADTDLAVLILGENGTGKEVVAQSIHYLSRRRDQPFIAVNCAAIPETLAESELFGHEKGAFTDAREARPGQVRAGRRRHAVPRRDRRLEPQRPGQAAARAGGEGAGPRGRLDADPHRRPAAWPPPIRTWPRWCGQKRFREDLYFRLNVVTLDLPPLRERADDILLLAEHFLSDFCRRARRKTPAVHRRRPQAAGGAPLAGQRPRVAEPDGAAGLSCRPRTASRPRTWRSFSRPAARRRWWPICSQIAGRRDDPFPDRVHSPHDRAERGQHEPGRQAPGPAPLEPLPQDAATGNGGPLKRGPIWV